MKPLLVLALSCAALCFGQAKPKPTPVEAENSISEWICTAWGQTSHRPISTSPATVMVFSFGNGCETDRKHDRLDKARLEVMQKALAYIAKMAARNPKDEQDAGEFLERMGRILAASEGK